MTGRTTSSSQTLQPTARPPTPPACPSFFATHGFHPRCDFELDIRTDFPDEIQAQTVADRLGCCPWLLSFSCSIILVFILYRLWRHTILSNAFSRLVDLGSCGRRVRIRGGWPRQCSLLLTQPLYFVNYIVGRKALPCSRLPHEEPLLLPSLADRFRPLVSLCLLRRYTAVFCTDLNHRISLTPERDGALNHHARYEAQGVGPGCSG